ncbi:23S rRNA m(5)U-1939 methyltransferase [Hoeflea marina]|uniref:23S rRNA m(5)U-1939 methyltransferase n=1 Tax=Hoeflea marina TaxID=274592 RepID=A0A317PLJ4_9HYPH|nr:class I SAM-dependent RNA methyltransferase [Hoeflea marina]PWW01835.1 23S rRNA m(5)U-1939 methyltransferase [Hoeflea marina]
MNARTLDIDRLGAQGDGIADGGEHPTFVSYTVPGDKVTVSLNKSRGTLLALIDSGPDRVPAPCPHFGPDSDIAECGGCVVQHVALDAYGDWKRDLVVSALESRGLDVTVAPLVRAEPGARRRVVFAARRSDRGIVLGFNKQGSHDIVAIGSCLVATPRINRELDTLRKLANVVALGPQAFRYSVLDTASGFDIAVDAPFKLSDKDRLRIADAVRRTDGVARLSFNEEVLLEKNPPQLNFGAVTVNPPPGSFVQASEAADLLMSEIVSGHLGKAKRVVDLFSGCGTFALRLATKSTVHAVEASGPALASLDKAYRAHPGLRSVTVEKRDLIRRPLMTQELKIYQGLVFDPPRAGAEVQAQEIARSVVPKVAAVSCNPITLARDLAILVAGGYRVTSVTPIDQFLWTPHVEVVALLEKKV